MGIPRLSKIYQDSKIWILQDVPQLFKISKIPKHGSPNMYHNNSRFPRFQDTDFPRCTTIIQDFKDFKILILQDVLRFTNTPRAFKFIQEYQGFIEGPSCCSFFQKIQIPFLFEPTFPNISNLLVSMLVEVYGNNISEKGVGCSWII